MGRHRSCPYDDEVYFYAVQTAWFMGGYKSRPYEGRFWMLDVRCVCFYAVQTKTFIGGT